MMPWQKLSPLGQPPHSQALFLPRALSYSEIYSTCQVDLQYAVEKPSVYSVVVLRIDKKN